VKLFSALGVLHPFLTYRWAPPVGLTNVVHPNVKGRHSTPVYRIISQRLEALRVWDTSLAEKWFHSRYSMYSTI